MTRAASGGYEPAIRVGYNNAGQEHEIHEATHPPYFCRECNHKLSTPRVTKIRPYFRHERNTQDRECPLLQKGGDDAEFERTRNASIIHATNRLRLFIKIAGYQNEARLYGVLPSLTAEDLAGPNIELAAEGTVRPVEVSDLAPTRGQGWIELRPGADRFDVEVRPTAISIGGRWRAAPPGPGGFFVGSEVQAEYVYDPRRVTSDDWLYVPASGEDHGPSGSTRIPLGEDRILFKMRANAQTMKWLQHRVPDLRLDEDPLRVNLLLPFSSDVNAQASGVIHGPPGSKALLAIIPPKTNDPQLELYPIPFHPGAMVALPYAGVGVVRFVELTIDPHQARRLLVHWPGRQGRDVTLDISASDGAVQQSSPSVSAFGLRIGGERVVHAVLEHVVGLDPVAISAAGPTAPRLELVCPDKYTVELVPEFLDEQGKRLNRSEGSVNAGEFEASIRDVLARGPTRVLVVFPGIGSVDLHTQAFYNHLRQQEDSRRRHEENEAQARRTYLEARKREEEKRRTSQAAAQSVELARRKQAEAAEQARIEQLNRERVERIAAETRERQRKQQEELQKERQKALDTQRRALLEKNLRDPSIRIPHHISLAAAGRLVGLAQGTPREELAKWRVIARRLQKKLRRNGQLPSDPKPIQNIQEDAPAEDQRQPAGSPMPAEAVVGNPLDSGMPGEAPSSVEPALVPKPGPTKRRKLRKTSKPDSAARKKLEELRTRRLRHRHTHEETQTSASASPSATESPGAARASERAQASTDLAKLAAKLDDHDGDIPADGAEALRRVLGLSDEQIEQIQRYYPARLGNILAKAFHRRRKGGPK